MTTVIFDVYPTKGLIEVYTKDSRGIRPAFCGVSEMRVKLNKNGYPSGYVRDQRGDQVCEGLEPVGNTILFSSYFKKTLVDHVRDLAKDLKSRNKGLKYRVVVKEEI